MHELYQKIFWKEKVHVFSGLWAKKIAHVGKGSPQTLSGQLFLKNHKLKTVKQQKGKK